MRSISMEVILLLMLSVYAVLSKVINYDLHSSTISTIASTNSSLASINNTSGFNDMAKKSPSASKNKALNGSKDQDRDDYPPNHKVLHKGQEVPLGDQGSHWYVLYLKGKDKLKESVLKRRSFTHDLTTNIASKLELNDGEIHLNLLTFSGSDLSLNVTIRSTSPSKEKELMERLTKLVSKDVLSLTGETFLINRVVKSNKHHIIKTIHGLSYTHPYSHTVTLLQDDSRRHLQHERVELMLYLTIGGLCIFFCVLALSFLAIQFMKTGNLKTSDEDYGDEEEDWKILLRGSDGCYPQPDDRNPHHESNNFQDGGYFGERTMSHCNKCELEKTNTLSISKKKSGHRKSSLFFPLKRNYLSKWIFSLRSSRHQIDVNY